MLFDCCWAPCRLHRPAFVLLKARVAVQAGQVPCVVTMQHCVRCFAMGDDILY